MSKFIEGRKIRKQYDYYGTGFLIRILNVPMVKVFGEWTPDIDYQKLDELIFEALAEKPARLTGNEIHFIRVYSKQTLEQFGDNFGVTAQAVKKWESFGDDFTNMKFIFDKEIRMFILNEIEAHPEKFLEFWQQMREESMSNRHRLMRVEAEEMAVV